MSPLVDRAKAEMAKNRLRELEAKPNGEARKAKLRKDKLDIVKEIRKPIEDHQVGQSVGWADSSLPVPRP